jgi:hypothetical protein
MIASEIVAQQKQSNVDRHPPLAAIIPMPRPVVRSMSAETGQLAAIARRVGTFSAAQPCERSLNNFIGVARFGRSDRRAQGDRPTLRSITPTRAARLVDASVDPTEARSQPCELTAHFESATTPPRHAPGEW